MKNFPKLKTHCYVLLGNQNLIFLFYIPRLFFGVQVPYPRFLCYSRIIFEPDYSRKAEWILFGSVYIKVDNACMQLVSRPQQFNNAILLMPNLYGNIISNIACGLVGGPGLVPGMNIGEEYAVFETGTRNTGTSLTGKDLANPTAFIRAAIDMLRYLGWIVMPIKCLMLFLLRLLNGNYTRRILEVHVTVQTLLMLLLI
uniref:Isopropylmalate dehydrogenase-like domain-containing protein n=1 Tax=Meloidogyne enterolobii TaxID=390850 RepID=A0A6V7XD24_MELEN|nr:unnamed protein product [Meloidogyne enterolobii]